MRKLGLMRQANTRVEVFDSRSEPPQQHKIKGRFVSTNRPWMWSEDKQVKAAGPAEPRPEHAVEGLALKCRYADFRPVSAADVRAV